MVSIEEIADFEQVCSLINLISDERKESIARYVFEKDKIRSLAAEILLRYILENRYGIDQREIQFEYNQYGKPYLKSPCNHIYFNLSHSGSVVVCVVGTSNLGIDVERISKREMSFAKSVLSQEEMRFWMVQSPDEMQKLFYVYWTLKESFTKYEGKGLGIPFQDLTFRQTSEGIILETDIISGASCEFVLNELKDEYYVALCVDKNEKKNVSTNIQIIEWENLFKMKKGCNLNEYINSKKVNQKV